MCAASCGAQCTEASFFTGAVLESPQVTVQDRGPRILLSSPTAPAPSAAPQQAPDTCSLSRTDTQQERRIKRKSPSHRQVDLSRLPNPVSTVDNAANAPHQPEARGGGRLGAGGPERLPEGSRPGRQARVRFSPWRPNSPPWRAPYVGAGARSARSGLQARSRSRSRRDRDSGRAVTWPGQAGARAPGSCGPHGAPRSGRPGANPTARTHRAAPGPRPSGAAGLE